MHLIPWFGFSVQAVKTRKIEAAVRDLALLLGPFSFRSGSWRGWPLRGATEADVAAWPCGAGSLQLGVVLFPSSLAFWGCGSRCGWWCRQFPQVLVRVGLFPYHPWFVDVGMYSWRPRRFGVLFCVHLWFSSVVLRCVFHVALVLITVGCCMCVGSIVVMVSAQGQGSLQVLRCTVLCWEFWTAREAS